MVGVAVIAVVVVVVAVVISSGTSNSSINHSGHGLVGTIQTRSCWNRPSTGDLKPWILANDLKQCGSQNHSAKKGMNTQI